MAQLTVQRTTGTSALFEVVLLAGDITIGFQKSGAVAPDLDLASLATGPLKTYLQQLANWASIAPATRSSKIRWSVTASNNAQILPVQAGAGGMAMGLQITQSALTQLAFRTPLVVPGGMSLVWHVELQFVHSLGR